MHRRDTDHSTDHSTDSTHRHIPIDPAYATWLERHELFTDVFIQDSFIEEPFNEKDNTMQAHLSTLTPVLPFPPQSASTTTIPPHPSRTAAGQRQIARGHILFENGTAMPGAFRLVEGEIVIMRRGMAIDLVEAGEYVDVTMWSGNTTAVARTDCTLAL